MFFLKDGGYCVIAAKVMKRANSKEQSECSCMYNPVWMYVLQNVSRADKLEIRGLIQEEKQKLKNINYELINLYFKRFDLFLNATSHAFIYAP